MARRIFLVGTDTDCGKTTVACALLRAAAAAGVRALPFKPAASGPVDERGDPERLVAAAGLVGLTAGEICPLRYAAPVAPGLAAAGGLQMSLWAGPKGQAAAELGRGAADLELSLRAGPEGQAAVVESGRGAADLELSLRAGPEGQAAVVEYGRGAAGSELSSGAGPKGQALSGRRDMSSGTGPRAPGALASEMSPGAGSKRQVAELAVVRARLDELEARYEPALTVIEGAGGLWVPMPGGSWLPAWIDALGGAPVVVGRLGLGTINHTLLTISALERLGLAPRGFILAQTVAGEDPSHAHNEAVIAAASGLECFGVLAFGTGAAQHGWLRGGVTRLLD